MTAVEKEAQEMLSTARRREERELAEAVAEADRQEQADKEAQARTRKQVGKKPCVTPDEVEDWLHLLGDGVLLPIKPRGKEPCRFNPSKGMVLRNKWQHGGVALEELLDTCALGAGLGVLTARYPVIDIDIDNQQVAAPIADRLIAALGQTPCRTRSNSGRCALLLRASDAPLRKRKWRIYRDGAPVVGEDNKEWAIELLGDGQQAMIAGIHPSGAKVKWSGLGEQITEVAPRDIDRAMDSLEPLLGELGLSLHTGSQKPAQGAKAGADTVPLSEPLRAMSELPFRFGLGFSDYGSFWAARSALQALAASGAVDDYDTWFKVGLALHSLRPYKHDNGDARELDHEGKEDRIAVRLLPFRLWLLWSQHSGKYLQDGSGNRITGDAAFKQLLDKWKSMGEGAENRKKGDRVGFGTLMMMGREAGAELIPPLDEFKRDLNDIIGMVNVRGAMLIARYNVNELGFTNVEMSRVGDFASYMSNQVGYVEVTDGKGGVKRQNVQVFREWCHWGGRRTYTGVTMEPRVSYVDDIEGMPAGDQLNLWVGYSIKPQEGSWDHIRYHIENVLCNGDPVRANAMLDWLALKLQRPATTSLPVELLWSREAGTGKNTMFEQVLMPVFGAHAVVIASIDDLLGQFNGHMKDAVLVLLNEVVWGGNVAMRGQLKAIIDEYVSINIKHLPQFMIPNRRGFYAASNSEWAWDVDMHDRRVRAYEVSPEQAGNIEYFTRLRTACRGGEVAAFMHAMMQRAADVAEVMKPAPWASVVKQTQLVKGLKPELAYVYELLRNGHEIVNQGDSETPLLETPDKCHAQRWKELKATRGWWENDCWIHSKALYDDYRLFNDRQVPRRSASTQVDFNRMFMDVTGAIKRKVRTSSGGKTVNTIVMPKLQRVCENFEKAVGVPLTWDDA
jgi:hypothetical protein